MFLGGKMFQVGDIVKSIYQEFDDIEDCGVIVEIGKAITISWFDGHFNNDYMAGEIELVTSEPS
jgi:hypothetical protein